MGTDRTWNSIEGVDPKTILRSKGGLDRLGTRGINRRLDGGRPIVTIALGIDPDELAPMAEEGF
jgi:hypothetical protein